MCVRDREREIEKRVKELEGGSVRVFIFLSNCLPNKKRIHFWRKSTGQESRCALVSEGVCEQVFKINYFVFNLICICQISYALKESHYYFFAKIVDVFDCYFILFYFVITFIPSLARSLRVILIFFLSFQDY